MAIKTTLSLSDRHRRFLAERVAQGVYATEDDAVADAIEHMMQDEEAMEIALSDLAEEIRARTKTDPADYMDLDQAFAAAGLVIAAKRDR
ncbi:hypothetical protein [Zavarzinia compransoris]|uniref:Type II toxin-antitoxin system ParD family antitoxin n=1 Tax=Zavarzinia compransoris TaxID=1264899 RepID=A0A317E0R0_9PROT|nr:hypothetical protein [Zavarzinia compransoris]PWR19700.1 hypothetical protein DKG75_14630 [Zavarzinia compransoris]TDP43354.1 hypothetical protein DES42_11255 [Zavarzinia compransoris]